MTTSTTAAAASMANTESSDKPIMKPMALWKEAIAYVTLGLLCGWYYFILLLYPTLIVLAFRGSYIAGAIFAFFILLTYWPLKYQAWEGFMYSYIWDIWREYFDFQYDDSSIKNRKEGERYIFFEFPHGVFPMGEFVSASVIREITPGKMICGSGADVVFMFPVMRQMMAWIGTKPARKEYYAKTFKEGNYAAVIPGGIAEMYLIDDKNTETESIYFKNRKGTVKMAIQQGANIIPVFFFGNTKLFHVVGGANTWLATLSRKLKASIMFFYGRNYLPVPYRHPIRMISGEIVEVKQNDNPTDEEIADVLNRVSQSVQNVYDNKKPAWEKRKLVIL
jgi:2-acylglycerol O-acyltransferase 2